MTAQRDPDRLIAAFLDEGPEELRDSSYDSVRSQIETKRQWVVLGPWREQQMTNFAKVALAAAAVVLVAVVGIRFLPGMIAGPGTTPSPTPLVTSVPTASPVPTAAPITDPEGGRLTAGTYLGHPFEPPNDGIGFRFIVPSDAWESFHGDTSGLTGIARYGDSNGLSMGFLQVASLNGDPCHWSGAADDVEIGPAVDDLVAALTSSSEYGTSEPSDVNVGGYAGKQVVVTMPASAGGREPFAVGCDEQSFMVWNPDGEGFAIPGQGSEHRWTLWILDVAGERVVINLTDYADSQADLVQELQSIVESIEITAP